MTETSWIFIAPDTYRDALRQRDAARTEAQTLRRQCERWRQGARAGWLVAVVGWAVAVSMAVWALQGAGW